MISDKDYSFTFAIKRKEGDKEDELSFKVETDSQVVFFSDNYKIIQEVLLKRSQQEAKQFINQFYEESKEQKQHKILGEQLKQILALKNESIEQIYSNSPIELEVLKALKEQFQTKEEQEGQIRKIISEFGNKGLQESIKVQVPHPNKPSQKLTKTIPSAQSDVLDIMCLAQLLFEGGDKKIATKLRIQVLQAALEDIKYPENLDYLARCLTNFKPAIYKNLREYFASKYEISQDQVQCLPKTTGQQVGAVVIVNDEKNKDNPRRTFYVKAHQEFSSKSDPQFGTKTSNGLGFVDLKELFMYKLLEKTGYGPKTEFIIDKDMSKSGVEEGIMIVTRDSGYTKQSLVKNKSFQTFSEIKADLQNKDAVIDDGTKIDVMVIDMISRAFLLEDVMVNGGNFGKVEVKERGSDIVKSKWKVIDFKPPKIEKGKEYLGDKVYIYTNHYGGSTIEYSFRKGNFSHTYQDDSPINKILEGREDKELLHSTVDIIAKGKGKKIGIMEAAKESLQEIKSFLTENQDSLGLLDKESKLKEQTARRMKDLEVYYNCTMKNIEELVVGVADKDKEKKI